MGLKGTRGIGPRLRSRQKLLPLGHGALRWTRLGQGRAIMNRPLAILLAAGSLAGAARAQVFFSDILNPDPTAGSIKRVNADGSGLAVVVDAGGGLRGLTIGVGTLYWTDVDRHAIRRATLAGTGVQDVITAGLDFPTAVRLSGGRIYWGDQTLAVIHSANLFGGNVRTVISTPFFTGLALDAAASRIYWDTSLTSTTGDIRRAALNGSGA